MTVCQNAWWGPVMCQVLSDLVVGMQALEMGIWLKKVTVYIDADSSM